MIIAITGATVFLGRHIANHFLHQGHHCRCWCRPTSDRSGFFEDGKNIEWICGQLNDDSSQLIRGADAVVHSALAHRTGHKDRRQDIINFIETNMMGTIRLIEQAKQFSTKRFVFISTCAVHEYILDDRSLDEAHPLWPGNHYGAYKAAVEKFIHSYGRPKGWPICALRPTGIYGPTHPISKSRWYDLISDIVAGKNLSSAAGGKEVHVRDVARAIDILIKLDPEDVAGQVFNCCDMYVAEQDIALIAKQYSGSASIITQQNKGPKHQIDTTKLRALGMNFGGHNLLESTIHELVDHIQRSR